MTFQELMKDFASVLGVGEIAPDADNGSCALDFDGNRVTFREDAQAKAVVMTAQIGELPDGGDQGVFAHILMEANFMRQGTGGAVLGIDADRGAYCLRRRDSLASLDSKAYSGNVETFLNVLEAWQRRLDVCHGLAEDVADFKNNEIAEIRRLQVGDGLIRA